MAPVVLALSFRRGPNTIEIPRIEARGTALTGAELRDILDPASSLTAAQRLARLSAASIAAAEITIKADADAAGGTPGPSSRSMTCGCRTCAPARPRFCRSGP